MNNILLLIVTIHWSVALGMYLAASTKLSIPQFMMLVLVFRYMMLSYGA